MKVVWGDRWREDPRYQVVYASVDPAPFEQPVDADRVRAELGIPSSACVALHVGRQAPAKNHGRLLSIFAEMRLAAPDSWLVIIGGGTDDPEGATMHRVRELGLGDRVRILGARDDVPRFLRAADVFLLPSLWEGLPGVVLEACAVGVPVLAADLPGVREIASRLSLVRVLPLTASDCEWAQTALTLPHEADHLQLRNRAAALFRQSPFHIDGAVASHRALWSTARRQETNAV